MKKIKKKSSQNYHFYSREILQYIAWTCLRNVYFIDVNGFGVLRATVKPCRASLDYHISVMYMIFLHLILKY